ncbi:MAG TPA: hypothetical protein VGE94_10700, partial [Chloroflexota bacterium]
MASTRQLASQVLQMDRLQRRFAERRGSAGHTVALHEYHPVIAQRGCQLIAQRVVGDEHRVRPERHRPVDQIAFDVKDRMNRYFSDAHDRGHRLVGVDDGLDIRSGAV